MNKAKIKAILQNNDFNILSEGKEDIEFGQYTPEGEDWFECLPWTSAKKFIEALDERIEYFDIDDEVEVWIPIRGTRGVPEKITDLIEDAKWKKEQLQELLKNLEEVAKQ